ERRGEKLVDVEKNEIFTGKFWAAQKSKELGLIDGIDTLENIMEKKFGEDYKLFPIETDKRSLLEKKFGVVFSSLSGELVQTVVNTLHYFRLNNKVGL
ncbi:MAG: S49 family peptidase, partial [Pseudomonadota bacterium]